MGNQFGKRNGESSGSSSGSSNNPQTQLNPNNNSQQVTVDLTSYESACQLYPDLRSFDSTLHDRTSRVINTLAVDAEDRSLSLDSIREVTVCLLEMNQEPVKVILECKQDIWKNKQLGDLVQDYFQNSLLNFDFCNALDKCLNRARDRQLIVQVALQRFDQEQTQQQQGGGGGGETNVFAKTLQELKNFKDAGDPFTKEFFSLLQSVYKQQNSMLEKLNATKKKLNKKLKKLESWRKVSNVIFGAAFAAVLICSVVAAAITAPPVVTAVAAAAAVPLGSMGKWLNSVWRKYEKEAKEERGMIGSMHIWTTVAIADVNSIRVLVEKLEVVIDGLLNNAEFAIREDEAVVVVIDEIKKKLNGFVKTVDDLAEHADKFRREITMARAVILQRIIKHLGND